LEGSAGIEKHSTDLSTFCSHSIERIVPTANIQKSASAFAGEYLCDHTFNRGPFANMGLLLRWLE